MESYHGLIITAQDAIILVEASRKKLIPTVSRRLTDYERATLVKNGAVFVWNENSSNMKRWTDGKNWSASRVNGVFLSYKEMQPTRTKERCVSYKNKGLVEQSFSVPLKCGGKVHVVSYLTNDFASQGELPRPSIDRQFTGLSIDMSLYPRTLLTGFDFNSGSLKTSLKRKLDVDDTVDSFNASKKQRSYSLPLKQPVKQLLPSPRSLSVTSLSTSSIPTSPSSSSISSDSYTFTPVKNSRSPILLPPITISEKRQLPLFRRSYIPVSASLTVGSGNSSLPFSRKLCYSGTVVEDSKILASLDHRFM